MPILVKKIISDVDNGDNYARWEGELPSLIEFESIHANIWSAMPTGVIGSLNKGSLINDGKLNQLINTGAYGIYYLTLRDHVCLKEIEVVPFDTIIDIHPANDASNSLVYVFSVGSSTASNLTIKGKVVDDGGETCQKLRAEEKDTSWREYIVKLSMKKATHMSAKGRGKAPDLMTADEVGTYVGLAVKTIRNWTSTNKIPSHKIHGVVRYRKAEIDEFIDKNKKITPRIQKKKK